MSRSLVQRGRWLLTAVAIGMPLAVQPGAAGAGGALPYIAAAPNIESFVNTFDTPGVRYIAFAYAADPQSLVTSYGLTAGCASITVQPYNDGVFTGVVQVGTGQATWNMVASPADRSFSAVVQVQTASPADQQALDVVVADDAAALPC